MSCVAAISSPPPGKVVWGQMSMTSARSKLLRCAWIGVGGVSLSIHAQWWEMWYIVKCGEGEGRDEGSEGGNREGSEWWEVGQIGATPTNIERGGQMCSTDVYDVLL